jgi:hypothetical protein
MKKTVYCIILSFILASKASAMPSFYPQDRKRMQDLFDFQGEFQVPRLYVFCRKDRRFHCLMMMRDLNGQAVRKNNGELWSLPVLALARQNKPYNEIGGYTPSGVYTIDSVMPEADRKRVYGENRRLIMNFIPASSNEQRLKSYLPESSWNYLWWNESVVARDMGRTALRIHGAGFKNYNPFSKHYPFVKTIGCIGTREGRYGSVVYNDQRVLLDELMKASDLEPTYRNETKIRAILYVVELNNKKEPVTLDELIWYLQRR